MHYIMFACNPIYIMVIKFICILIIRSKLTHTLGDTVETCTDFISMRWQFHQCIPSM